MKIILRIDDFPGTKPEEFWKHNLENFKKFDAVLEKNGVSEYVLGVIPIHTHEDHLKYLAENPRIKIAIHGFKHDERFLNEFRDFETEHDIYNKISFVKSEYFVANKKRDIVDYIPPHNVVDMKTCRALKRAGFENIHCGPGTDVRVITEASGNPLNLSFIYSKHPIWYGRSDEMMNRDGSVYHILANHAPPLNGSKNCLTLHWPWEHNIGLENLDKFLSQIREVF